MATTNIWQQFKSLIPEGARIVVTIIANNGNGTSKAKLRDGTVGLPLTRKSFMVAGCILII